jgi:hypothetical protein
MMQAIFGFQILPDMFEEAVLKVIGVHKLLQLVQLMANVAH